jgi:hypothetical protein
MVLYQAHELYLYDELHALNVMTSGSPGNDYKQPSKQRCKYVTVAKAGDLGLYYSPITEAGFCSNVSITYSR